MGRVLSLLLIFLINHSSVHSRQRLYYTKWRKVGPSIIDPVLVLRIRPHFIFQIFLIRDLGHWIHSFIINRIVTLFRLEKYYPSGSSEPNANLFRYHITFRLFKKVFF